jgi:WD40 repeat protein
MLLTSFDRTIKLWNVKTGASIREEIAHTGVVSALVWLPDDSGFVSAGMDKRIIVWDSTGIQVKPWGPQTIRIFDMALTPDGTKLVAVGMVPPPPITSTPSMPDGQTAAINGHVSMRAERRIVVFDFATGVELLAIPMTGELTSVKVSDDSKFALINHAPDEVHLWDLTTGRMARKYMGQRQFRHVIRSCFGGVDGKFIASGSEDSNVYIWHRETGVLLEALPGHGRGSVNSVAWNPQNERLFASCSDDCTIRIWEAPPPGFEGYVPSHSHSHTNGFEKSIATLSTLDGHGSDMME